MGATLASGRLLHAIGMLGGSALVRGFGMLLTYAALLVAAGRIIMDAVL
ncbi:MAPEG family protein [Bradyrhizobium sp. JR3.5]